MVASEKLLFLHHHCVLIEYLWNHAKLYPTLACITLDVLSAQASSVLCEQLFSGSKQIATDRWVRLGSKTFEELVIMNSAWGPELYNMAAWTTSQLEEINLLDFEEMLAEEGDLVDWDKEIDYEIEV